jgi:hypothetical protein
MFIRKKRFRKRTYYYIVKAFKDGKKPKQMVVKYLGNMENLIEKLNIAEKCLKKYKRD